MKENLFDLTDMDEAVDMASEDGNTSLTSEKPKPIYKGPPTSKEEAAAEARKHGFVVPVAYDYARYGVTDTTEHPAGAVDEGTSADRLHPDILGSGPAWAGDAAKYEWSDDFGEIAPRVPALEAELFESEYMNRKGDDFSKLTMDINITGPNAIKPCMSVSILMCKLFVTPLT